MPACASTAIQDPVCLAWRVHLLRQKPHRAAPLALCVVCVLAGGVWLWHSLLLALLPMCLLLLSVADYLFPIHYTLTEKGATARHAFSHLEMDWNAVRHVYLSADGVKLSPLRQARSRWEPLRGIFLRFDDNEAQVRDAVRRLRLGENVNAAVV